MRTTHNGRRTSRDPVQALRRDIDSLRQDVAAIVSGRMDAIGDRARDTWNSAAESVHDAADQARTRAIAAHKQFSKTVATRPVRSVAIAFAAGALGAMLVGRLRGD
jgi:ElaB/YqjD/DUF883 family membrane-anchored ribosome-binding protein